MDVNYETPAETHSRYEDDLSDIEKIYLEGEPYGDDPPLIDSPEDDPVLYHPYHPAPDGGWAHKPPRPAILNPKGNPWSATDDISLNMSHLIGQSLIIAAAACTAMGVGVGLTNSPAPFARVRINTALNYSGRFIAYFTPRLAVGAACFGYVVTAFKRSLVTVGNGWDEYFGYVGAGALLSTVVLPRLAKPMRASNGTIKYPTLWRAPLIGGFAMGVFGLRSVLAHLWTHDWGGKYKHPPSIDKLYPYMREELAAVEDAKIRHAEEFWRHRYNDTVGEYMWRFYNGDSTLDYYYSSEEKRAVKAIRSRHHLPEEIYVPPPPRGRFNFFSFDTLYPFFKTYRNPYAGKAQFGETRTLGGRPEDFDD